jgi:uncharacterized protein (TIGR03083 family)
VTVGAVGAAYAGCRQRITDLTSRLDEQRAAQPVATCPLWTVHDVVAHLAGVVDDALAGRLDGAATEPWTATQVDARRGTPIAAMLADWDAQAPAFEELLDAIGDPGRQVVADIVTHEHDLRSALGEPDARDSDAVHIGVGFLAPRFVGAAAQSGLVVRVRANDGASFGDEGAEVVLTGDAFELLRAMTGRRSVDQLRSMDWHGDREAVLPAFTFGPFHPSTDDIEE